MAIYLKKCFNFYEKYLGVSWIIDIVIINLKIFRKKMADPVIVDKN